MFDIQTLFSIIIFVSLSLGGAIWVASGTEKNSGLRELAYALILHGVAYILYLGSLLVGEISAWLAEMALGLFVVFAARAIWLFYSMEFPRKAAILFMALIGLSSVIYAGDYEMKIVANSLFIIPMFIFALFVSMKRLKQTHGRGKYLVLAAMIVNLILLLVREFSLTLKIGRIETFYDSDFSQSMIFLASLFGLIFLAIGFVLMTKERADFQNQELILRDRLTGVWNRRKLEEVSNMELNRLLRTGSLVSMLLIDLDDFKKVNDRFGHVCGDAVLKEFAAVCSGALRDIDVFGRWGGEEFIAILPGAGVDEAISVAERLRIAVGKILVEDVVSVTVSIGVSLAFSSDTVTSWFERADAALYSAKSDGKNRWYLTTPLCRDGGILQVAWGERLLVGIAKIDAEHAKLVELANNLLKLLAGNRGKHTILEMLYTLSKKLIYHCSNEEELIALLNPERLTEHAKSHEQLLGRLQFLTELYENDNLSLNAFIQFIVFEICIHHIIHEDQSVFGHRTLATGLVPSTASETPELA